jgi:hypothetical protein
MSSTEWREPLLIEYEFEVGAERRKGVARLGLPRFVRKDEWACPFQLCGVKGRLSVFGIKDGDVYLARCVDGLGALSNAVSAIRRSLERLKAVGTLSVRFPENVAYVVWARIPQQTLPARRR